ncbi:MAG: hypothetical protein ACRC8N_12275, partial [Aeromonas veronii]
AKVLNSKLSHLIGRSHCCNSVVHISKMTTTLLAGFHQPGELSHIKYRADKTKSAITLSLYVPIQPDRLTAMTIAVTEQHILGFCCWH